jgi:hypothetical protein
MPRKRNKQTCSCGKQFIPRKRYFGVPEGGWLCGVHGPSGIAARSSGYSCGLPESSGSSTGTDADVSEVAGAVSSGDVATSDVGVTEESSAALTGTGADVCASPPVSRRKRGRVATGGTPVRAPPNSSSNESNESVDSFREKRSLGTRVGSTPNAKRNRHGDGGETKGGFREDDGESILPDDDADIERLWLAMEDMLMKDFPSVDEAQKWFEDLAEGFEKDPRAALMLFHMKSALEAQLYDPIDYLTPPTSEEAFACLRKCQEKIGQEAEYCACAGCQMRCAQSECTKHSIGDPKLGHLGQTSRTMSLFESYGRRTFKRISRCRGETC